MFLKVLNKSKDTPSLLIGRLIMLSGIFSSNWSTDLTQCQSKF